MPRWITVFTVSPDASPGQVVSSIPIVLGVVVAIVMTILWRRNLRTTANRYQRVFAVTGFPLIVVFIFVGVPEIQRRHWVGERKALVHDAVVSDCRKIEGSLTNIAPEGGGGEMSFTLAGHRFDYDSHSLGLKNVLCTNAGPRLCVGDIGRICLDNHFRNEIIKIEKLGVAEPPSSRVTPRNS